MSDYKKPNLLLGVSGSVAGIKLKGLVEKLTESFSLRIVITENSKCFIKEIREITESNDIVPIYEDNDEWESWSRMGDMVLHVELAKWANAMLIAPLSANTLAKISNGLCDNLLTCVVRCWDYKKPLIVAPAMNTMMWENKLTGRQLNVMRDLGGRVIEPIVKKLACGDYGQGAMAEVDDIRQMVQDIYLQFI